MTDQNPLYIDDDGREMRLEQSPDYANTSVLTVSDAVDQTYARVLLPQRVADAIRTALAVTDDYAVVAHPRSARFADVAPLLAQCDRADADLPLESRYLHTSEIRHLLGQPVPCGEISSDLAGARCSRQKHGSEAWHVDMERRLRWRTFGEGFEVRGWSPDEMEAGPADDLAPTQDVEPSFIMPVPPAHLAEAMDICQVPADFTPAQVRERFRSRGMQADEISDDRIAGLQQTRGSVR